MKEFKRRVACVLMAVVMAIGMAGAAFAADEGAAPQGEGSIVINDAVNGQTYSVYQILDLESYDTTKGAYSYKAASEKWGEFLGGVKDVYVDVDNQGYVTWKCQNTATDHVHGVNCTADPAAFAKLALAYAKEKGIDATDAITAEGATVEFTGLDLGYYLLDSSLGALCSLDTTNPTVTMEEKNDTPVIKKEVLENSTDEWGAINDADFNQTVNFKATITAQAGAQNYVMHDKMSAGLTFAKVDSVYVGETAETKVVLTGEDYSVVSNPGDDDCTFHVVFTQDYLNTIKAETKIYVEYSATLNSNAKVGVEGNSNEARLIYGDDNKTEWSKTTTYTWNMNVLKFGNDDTTNVLAGAEFVLLNNTKTMVAVFADGKFSKWEAVPEDGKSWPTGAVQTTDGKGSIAVAGLDADTYNLREVAAPAGYNKLKDDVVVNIVATADADKKTLSYEPVTADVNNQSGPELPSTGGMGTTLIYAAGALLILASAVLLVVRRRAADSER